MQPTTTSEQGQSENANMELFQAVHEGDVDTVKALVNKTNINSTFLTPADGPLTALHCACSMRKIEVVKVLLKVEGVDVDPVNGKGETPLLISAFSGSDRHDGIVLSIIHFLLTKGANQNAVDNEGNNALHLAVKNDIDGIRIGSLTYLGIDVNATNNEGKTPLHFAISNLNSKSVKALLDGNADPLFVDKDDKTYLHLLAASGNRLRDEQKNIAKSLIEKGVDINAVDNEGKTALQIAVENCNTGIIKLLLENGANTYSFTAGSNENKTLIEVIALNADENIPEQNKIINFDKLFEYGVEINTQFLEDPNTDISDDIKDHLRKLYTPKNIKERNDELHNKYVVSILNGDPLPRCNDFIGGVIVQAIKSIKLDEIKDIPEIKKFPYYKVLEENIKSIKSKIKKSDYYKLIELNKNIENSDEIIKAIIKYPKEFEKLVETSSKLKATSKGVTQGSQIDQTQTPQTQVLFDINLSGIILENSDPKFKKALGPSATKLTNYLMETEFSNFIKAISDNNLEKVKALANEKNINRTLDGQITPLEIAVLANEKNINRTLDGQITSLGIAVEKGSNEIVEFLLKKGAKISEESLKTLREKYEKNDLITKRLNLVEEKQKSRVSSEPSATTQSRVGSPTQELVKAFSQIGNDKQGGGR